MLNKNIHLKIADMTNKVKLYLKNVKLNKTILFLQTTI